MRLKSIVAAGVLFSAFALANTEKKTVWKNSNDPCPKGSHQVEVQETFEVVEESATGTRPMKVTETHKVCRDNSKVKIQER